MAIRAGGYIDRGDGKGWVLYAPAPAADVPEPAGPQPPAPPATPAVGEPGEPAAAPDTPDPQPAAQTAAAGRVACPDCGREFAVNKDGTMRRHRCVINAPAPQVTFDGEE
jgi:hypothetical protein